MWITVAELAEYKADVQWCNNLGNPEVTVTIRNAMLDPLTDNPFSVSMSGKSIHQVGASCIVAYEEKRYGVLP